MDALSVLFSFCPRSTLRATLFLMPLFGFHMILTSNRGIAGDTCTAENTFYFVSFTMEGLQGVMVATFFCYLNTEVSLGKYRFAFVLPTFIPTCITIR